MSSQDQNLVTSGLTPGIAQKNYGPLVSNGLPIVLDPTPQFNKSEKPATYVLNTNLNLSPQQLADLQSMVAIKNFSGSKIVPTPAGFLQLGSGYTMNFDPATLQGRITPALATSELSANKLFGDVGGVYTGADLRLMIEAAEMTPDGQRCAKQLIEATTITISVHREMCPVRASGYINPKGFALGKRTIAGTLIVNQFSADVMLSFLQDVMVADGSKDTVFTKIDQLPPFNITLIFTNELGYASERKLLGVKFVTEGVVYSIQDMMVEQTISFMANDFTPLVPLTLTSLYQPVDPFDPRTRREKVPSDLMNNQVKA